MEQFRRAPGPRALIVSPDVGGAGWNLQFAHKCALLERPYNPAVEDQMIARAHRLGQTRPVEVLLPVATLGNTPTFDELLHRLLEDKRALASTVLAPSATPESELLSRFSVLTAA